MMTMTTLAMGLLDLLTGLRGVSWSDPRASLSWRYDLPLWMWLLIAVGSAILASWSYSRLIGPRPARVALGTLRVAGLLWLAVLLAQPMIVISRERVEPDWLLVLVDRSASMRVRDMREPREEIPTIRGEDAAHHGASTASISRDEAVREALARQAGALGGRDRKVVWLGFDEQLRAGEVDPLHLPEATGQATALRTAIDQALARASGQPISGVVLMTDGRSPQSTGLDLAQRLKQRGAAVFAVPLGSSANLTDLAIAQVESPRKAYVDDMVPVSVSLDIWPQGASPAGRGAKLKLIDTDTGAVLDEQPAATDLSQPVTLRAVAKTVGPTHWRVQAELAGDQEEIVLENNRQDVSVDMVDTPIRVLYIEGYPRWEYRYLAALLKREKSIKSSMMLISADRQFVQEGHVSLSRLPMTRPELSEFDVIILGDVPAGYFSAEQLGLIRDHVATQACGLLWIAGSRDTPASYENTPLASLLPMTQPGKANRDPRSVAGVIVQPTPLAKRLSVLQLLPPGEIRPDHDLSAQPWPSDLPRLLWLQQLGTLKPTAESLADAASDAGEASPLLLRLRYGTGESLYLATDDTWRWRYARGEAYHQQFWTQLIRMLGRNRIQQDHQRAQLAVSHRRVSRDQTVVVTLTLREETLLRRQLPKVVVNVTADAGDREAAPRPMERIELIPDNPPLRADQQSEQDQRIYRGLWKPGSMGKVTLTPADPVLDDLGLACSVEVLAPDDELRQPAPDPDRLAAIARDTGGAVVPLNHLNELSQLVPNRARRIPDDLRQPLWNTYVALVVFLLLITAEWIGRKVIRLV
ncbi:MAG: hypothetical protein IT440_14435 [Phycisphaeraceae bacterium]|nr:hypothetical protein [Phycisphaeraceae bacterium]